ncbi:MAG: hypothetical protein RL150_130 [Candidatus Parcubacteria bacterium]|jgi:poly-gamma-glutamate synthesis protein (capsule biosynthesis protein)
MPPHSKPTTHLILRVLALVAIAVLVFLIIYPHVRTNQQPETQPAEAQQPSPVKPAETQSSDTLTLLVVGDMQFDRYIRKMSERHGAAQPFSCVASLLQSVDMVVGNLEGPITEYPSVSVGTVMGSPNNYRFTFPTTTAALLKEHNVDIVNIGNNHIGDFGAEGVASTKQYLTESGVAYFGGQAGDGTVHRVSEGDIQLSFVNYNQFGGDAPEDVARVIARERAAGQTVLVYTHWGEEYVAPTERVRVIAQSFVDAGAAIVIGSHPHVVQESAMVGDIPVYYSLGNFIFDQYWDDEVSTGLGLLLTVTPDGISVAEQLFTMHLDGRTCAEG